jgi:tetratricopeptide (TPR) repeat protein
MGRRKRSRQPAKTDASPRRRIPHRVRLLWVLVAVLAVLALMFGRPVATWYVRQLAARQLNVGAVSAAQQWLTWAAWLDPDDGRTDLLQAACLRRWQQVELFVRALESAARKGVPAAQIEQQRQLGLVQAGRLERRPDLQMQAMLEAGLPPHEVVAAFVFGFLVCDQPEEATKLLDAWAADGRPNAEIAYLRGIVWQWLEKSPEAREQWEAALVIEPRHEQARLSLAELFEQQDRVQDAWTHYAELARRSPRSEQARVGMARLLRKTGQLSAARTVLESVSFQPTLKELWAEEMGQIEFESDRFEQALDRFKEAGLDASEDGPVASRRSHDARVDATDTGSRTVCLPAPMPQQLGRGGSTS